MFRKNKQPIQQIKKLEGNHQFIDYYSTMNLVQEQCEKVIPYTPFYKNYGVVRLQIKYLEYIEQVIKNDLAASYAINFLQQKTTGPQFLRRCFPISSHTPVEKCAKIDFSNKTVLAKTYNPKRLTEAFCTLIHEPFHREQRFSQGLYIKNLELIIIVDDGTHHASVAQILKTGYAYLDVYDLDKAKDYLTVESNDGFNYHWVVDPSGEHKEIDFMDHRYPLLYSLYFQRKEYEEKLILLEQNTQIE